MDKKSNLKARGIRFTDEAWRKLSGDAKKKSTTPSEIVRVIIDKHYTDLEIKAPKIPMRVKRLAD